MTKSFWVNPNLTVVPKLTPGELEKMLELLPGPNDMIVSVHEGSVGVDYSPLKKRIQEDCPAIKDLSYLPDPKRVELRLDYLERNIALGIYREFYENMLELEHGGRQPFNHRRVRLDVKMIHWGYNGPLPPGPLEKWEKLLPDSFGLNIDVTPDEVGISYHFGKEPQVVSLLKTALTGTKAEVKIEAYDPDK